VKLSGTYSTSPSLSLKLKASQYRQYFLVCLALAVLLANYRTYVRGYPILALGLALVCLVLLWRSWRDPMVGAVLMWESGEWFLRYRGRQTSVLILPGTVQLPWIIYLGLAETHAKTRWKLWLFVDSADAEKMRRLRCQLLLERAG